MHNTFNEKFRKVRRSTFALLLCLYSFNIPAMMVPAEGPPAEGMSFEDAARQFAILKGDTRKKIANLIGEMNKNRYFVIEAIEAMLEFGKSNRRAILDASLAPDIAEYEGLLESGLLKLRDIELSEFLDQSEERIEDEDAVAISEAEYLAQRAERIKKIEQENEGYKRALEILRRPSKPENTTHTSMRSQVDIPLLGILEVSCVEDMEDLLASIVGDFFMTPETLAAIPYEVLRAQLDALMQARATKFADPSEEELALFQQKGLMPHHIKVIIDTLENLIKIHQSEITRRMIVTAEETIVSTGALLNAWANVLMAEANVLSVGTRLLIEQERLQTTAQARAAIEVEAEPSVSDEDEQKQAAVAPKKRWNVDVKKRMARKKEEMPEPQQRVFEDLMRYLETNGPIVHKRDPDAYQFRNFSSLSPEDYHCHLGNSGYIAIWKVLDAELGQIAVYYVGPHPNTYKRLVRR